LLRAVQCKAVVVVQPVILKLALDFKQLGYDRVACHCGRVDDSPVARAIKTAPSQQNGRAAWQRLKKFLPISCSIAGYVY
jgi:hypothetical protein